MAKLRLTLALTVTAVMPGVGHAVTMVSSPSIPVAPSPRAAPRHHAPQPQPVSGVPEPGVWALVAAGFAVAGLAIRRRPSATVVAS